MKKLVYILSIGGLFVAFSSCQQGNVEELKKADDEKVNARVQTMIDELNTSLEASCTAKVDSAAQHAFMMLPKAITQKPTGGKKPGGGIAHGAEVGRGKEGSRGGDGGGFDPGGRGMGEVPGKGSPADRSSAGGRLLS